MILDLFRKKQPLDPASREILDQAMVQRSRMDLLFEEKTTSLKDLSCAVNTLGKDSLVLDVYGLSRPGSFTGKRFTCYFRIREGRSVGFYAFSSRVEEVRQAKHGGVVFLAALPERVERSQRRRSMRVRPEIGWFEEIHLWRGGQRGEAGTDEILLGLRELRQGRLCRLENMSAGGLGLFLARGFREQAQWEPALGEEYTLYLRFAHEVRNQPRELWLSGRAVRAVLDPVARDVALGIEFTHVGRKDPEGRTAWLAVADNAAEELVTRVFQWHATLARERATTD